ncbi:MAG: hypothetical protein LBR79_00345 [Oscillospiraceae bacterium]|jgi:hypothetical protein|nr:hypothetical protein [Oscillospiraceae bacterium]
MAAAFEKNLNFSNCRPTYLAGQGTLRFGLFYSEDGGFKPGIWKFMEIKVGAYNTKDKYFLIFPLIILQFNKENIIIKKHLKSIDKTIIIYYN